MRHRKTALGRIAGALAAAALSTGLVQPQQTAAPDMHITTQERLETETWWPTMANAPLQAYAGSQACTGCHAGQSSSVPTGMQRAATRGTDAGTLADLAPASFVSGPLTYALDPDKVPPQLSVAVAGRKATQPVDWIVGAGDLGRTFLYAADGKWFQSEATLYTRPLALDVTTGFAPATGNSPTEALGNILSPAEARACFGCHTVHATTSAGLQPVHAEPGVGCEACHGPGQQHVVNAAAGNAKASATIFQPAKLSPSDSIDFCGACHRSSADASLSTGPRAERAAVRFQPARLEQSRCWRATRDARLTCVACHDPHQPLERNVAAYDRNCLQCHSGAQAARKTCPQATHDCVTCHMPRVNLPSMHGDFTDHYIRIANESELPRR